MTETIVRGLSPPSAAHAIFCEQRRLMIAAWRVWLEHAPSGRDISNEVDATGGMVEFVRSQVVDRK